MVKMNFFDVNQRQWKHYTLFQLKLMSNVYTVWCVLTWWKMQECGRQIAHIFLCRSISLPFHLPISVVPSYWLLLHWFVRVSISSRRCPAIRSLLSCFQSTGNAAKVFQFKIEREALRGLKTRTTALNIAWPQMEARARDIIDFRILIIQIFHWVSLVIALK